MANITFSDKQLFYASFFFFFSLFVIFCIFLVRPAIPGLALLFPRRGHQDLNSATG